MKLTQKAVASLQLPAGKTDVIHFDDVPGFGYRLRKGAGGKVLRSWICQYRHGGATRRLLLGAGEVLSAEQARTMAKKALGKVANGEDPQASKLDRRGKDAHSLRATIVDYLAVKKREVRPRTYTEVARYLTDRRYFGPLHTLALDQITRKDVASRLNRISLESSSIVAGRARATLSAFYVWAMQAGIVEANPVIGTAKPRESPSRDRVLADAEMAAIWRACGNDDHGRCIRLLILLGARRQEIGGIAWSEFNFEQGTWTLPAARSKNGRAHTLPVLPAMLAIIKDVPRMAGRDQLFGARANGFTGWGRGKAVLDERTSVKNFTTHDLRRSVATGMANLGVAPHVIEQILNHQSGHRAGPAGIYNRSSYEREVRSALALWHDHLRTLVAGGKRKVVHIAPHVAT
jgi:integrase